MGLGKRELTRETLNLVHANNKGTNQPAHQRSLISTFVSGLRGLQYVVVVFPDHTHFLRIIVFAANILAVAQQTGLSISWLETPKTGFGNVYHERGKSAWFLSFLDLFFPKSTFSKTSFRYTIKGSKSFDPDQARPFVGPALDSNCLQKLSASDTSR